MEEQSSEGFFSEICQKNKITDYLLSRGFEPSNRTGRVKYKCPLPSHPGDNTPSFYITERPDGSQLFKCFGCGQGGNIITIIRLMEGHKNGQIVRRLAKASNIAMGNYIDSDSFNIDPSPYDIISRFCEEDEGVKFISEVAKEFIRANDCSEDSVNKISKIYELLDDMIETGDVDRIRKTFAILEKTMMSYEG